ncbi:hypothetical protein A1O7_05788 [Cladophialophora yegresii CBS 114405]|uniref:Phosphatidylethanolamine-binding protein n=1 Tax=Cladophialophora yegresii CBS 114405 TaxID=1182544 RepID=W9VS53_9EURO|nr:uncharacterized protein A1O7_05788 [Cladophialophora yegresii CBS 114405]EXJ58363.1 hypothetical protein A1O7_05788 [Cladophialophora yegresii CBS 114405]
MNHLCSLALLALAALVSAQSAPGFPIQVDTNLRADFQDTSTSISPAGVLLNRDDVLEEPTIVGPSDSTRTIDYMVFMVDQDVISPSDPSTRIQFLHWYQPNLAGASEVLFDFDSDSKNFTSATPLAYIPPTPPGGDIAHRYTLIMFRQPEGFNIPSGFESFFEEKSDLSNRLDFDIAAFVSASGLGEPVGANWFQVQNKTASGSTSSSTTQSASATSTSTEASSTESATSTATTSTSTETENTSASGAKSTTTASAEVATSTAVVTPSQTLETIASPAPSSSATISSPAAGAAGIVASIGRGLMVSFVLTIAGAGWWLL